MRYVVAGAFALALLATRAGAEPLTIDQSAWHNYTIIVNTSKRSSDLQIRQRGALNAVSSIQVAGSEDARIRTIQRGNRNAAAIYQSGWNTISQVQQSGPDGGGERGLPTRYAIRETDEGYLSYFMTGGFSLVTLTDQNHTWVSRFGRAR